MCKIIIHRSVLENGQLIIYRSRLTSTEMNYTSYSYRLVPTSEDFTLARAVQFV